MRASLVNSRVASSTTSPLSTSHLLSPVPLPHCRANNAGSTRSAASMSGSSPLLQASRGPQLSKRGLLGVVASELLLTSSKAYAAGGGQDEDSDRPEPFIPREDDPPTYVTATGRIVAIGDLHGDLDKAVEALKLAKVISVTPEGDVAWCGGDTTVVQLGDVLDRGNVEIGILNLLRFLDSEARQQGGAVYMLNGNHESLNICGDFRYVTPGAFAESAVYGGLSEADLKDWQLVAMVRYQLFKPGGGLAKEFAKNPTVLVVNDTAFAHGGLLPTHVQYGVERLNHEVCAWMRGDTMPDGKPAPAPMLAIGNANSVMWNRTLSKEHFSTPSERYHACRALQQALGKIGAKRLVVGHTPQLTGANCECDNQVWRIDVGMSYGVLNRPVQILEINKAPEDDGQPSVRIVRQPSADEFSQLQVAGDL